MSDKNKSIFDDKIEKTLSEIAKEGGIRNFTFGCGCGSKKGDGYMGIINTIKIIDNESDNETDLIIKSAPKSNALRSQLKIEDIFGREIYMYSKVFPVFSKLERQKQLQASKFVPKHYKSSVDYGDEFLILDNLKVAGFQLYEKRIPMDEDHVRFVLSEYGRLHALSFALRDQAPEEFEKVVASMDDVFSKNVLGTGFVKNFIDMCTKAQEALDENEDREALSTYKTFVSNIQHFLEDLFNKPRDEYDVALHGDCWTNNMMFKYEDEANPTKPTQLRFLDFQVSRCGNPTLDLSHFFYACCPIRIINNLDEYLHVYHNSLSEYLRKLGSDPEKLFPFSVLEEQWKTYSRYGLMLSMLVIHVMLTEEEETIDFADISEEQKSITGVFNYEIKGFDQYKGRVRPIILHFVENKFI